MGKGINISEDRDFCRVFRVGSVRLFLHRSEALIDQFVRQGVAGKFGVALHLHFFHSFGFASPGGELLCTDKEA